jgi:hypothetical protein
MSEKWNKSKNNLEPSLSKYKYKDKFKKLD